MVKFVSARKIAKATSPVGFTLMELLLVIAIMGVLTTMALAMLRSANESARVSATQARISRIESILNAEMERYEVRRLPVSRQTLVNYINANPSPVPVNVRLAMLHKRILQDLINCELPRPLINGPGFARNPDLGVFPSQERAEPGRPFSSLTAWLDNRFPTPIGNPPLRLSEELQKYRSASVQSWADPRYTGSPAIDHPFNHPAEYLYEILARIDMDGVPALETLGTTSFGDSDNDGFLEVMDAWGEPLLWFVAQVDVKRAPDFPGFPVDPNDTTSEIYEDWVPVDWTQRQATGMPVGYTVLDSTIPRDLQQIRITVFSKRMNDQGIYNTN